MAPFFQPGCSPSDENGAVGGCGSRQRLKNLMNRFEGVVDSYAASMKSFRDSGRRAKRLLSIVQAFILCLEHDIHQWLLCPCEAGSAHLDRDLPFSFTGDSPRQPPLRTGSGISFCAI